MTKKIFFLAAIIITGLNALSQPRKYFEGKIAYEFSFKADNLPDPQKALSPFLGNGSILYFKQGNYRHEYDGGFIEFDLYIRKDNKMYLKKRDNDTIYWSDCSLPGDSIESLSYTSKSDTVAKIICDRLLIKYKDKSEIHYYNSDLLRINPEWFKDFKLNQEYLVDQKEKSIYLKSVHSFNEFALIETAIKITPEVISIGKFKLPEHAVLAPANF